METGLFVQHTIVLAVKRLEFVSDRMSYIVQRGRLFTRNITVWRLIVLPLKGWNSSNIWEQT